jgi:hypothetical protein
MTGGECKFGSSSIRWRGAMSKSEDEKMAKLIKKNMAKAEKAKPKTRRKYDPTLPAETTDDDLERRDFFSEMKKREF